MTNYFSYVIEHDYGLAPNPFGGFCTLSVCKPRIRKNRNINIGDWVIGTGSKKLNKVNHLIYAMRLDEKLTLDEYWHDSRFEYKKPIINGSLTQIYGDNFYHLDENENWIQEKSAHSVIKKEKHSKRDTSGVNVLISKHFYYLGDNAVLIPKAYHEICKKGPGMKYKGLEEIGGEFISWVETNVTLGISGDPINWREYNQTKLII